LFRNDIRGLRAVAVIAVVLYHFRVPGFSSGFAGVDVFFVISGYLMTGILTADLDTGRFSLLRFYGARIRRIVPALSVVCIAATVAGGWLLLPDDFERLAQHALASLAFVSNHVYLAEAGYFDVAAREKWLLHTWSLSVEWQFYLLLPLFLWLCRRMRDGQLATARAFILAILASLAFMLSLPQDLRDDAFFLLAPRAWELLCGGLVAILERRWTPSAPWQRPTGVAGVLCIAVTPILAPAPATWPAWETLLPVVGTTGVLVAGSNSPRFLAGRLLGWVGDRSYSLYLWHWLVLVVLLALGTERWLLIGAGLCASLVLAELSYRFVERPFRGRKAGDRRRSIVLATLVGAASVIGAVVVMQEGLPQRVPPEALRAAAESRNRYSPLRRCERSVDGPWDSCRYGSGPVGVVLIGDSHADAVASGLAESAIASGHSLLLLVYPSCPTVYGARWAPGVFRAGQHCDAFNRWVDLQLQSLPPQVPAVLVARSSAYLHGVTEHGEPSPQPPAIQFAQSRESVDQAFLDEYTSALARTYCRIASRRPLFQVRPIPEMPVDVPRAMAKSLMSGVRLPPGVSIQDYRRRHRDVLMAQDRASGGCNVVFLDPVPFLCNGDRCSGGDERGQPWYYDDDHLSERGNRLLVPMFARVFERDGD
jgi:peptidoglycan/LPS O-acetylase OafA/YrhL